MPKTYASLFISILSKNSRSEMFGLSYRLEQLPTTADGWNSLLDTITLEVSQLLRDNPSFLERFGGFEIQTAPDTEADDESPILVYRV